MTGDDARALVRRWWDLWRSDDLSLLHELCTDPYTRHTSMGTETLSLAAYKKKLTQTKRALRGAVTTVDDQVVAGDKVWTRATSRGINLETVDASVMTWMTIHRIEDDRIAEVWIATLPGVEWRND